MARKKEYELRENRRIGIRLTEEAYLILREIRKQTLHFDFSKWVSTKLQDEFEMPKRQLLLDKIYNLQRERDEIAEKYNLTLKTMVKELQEMKPIEQKKEGFILSRKKEGLLEARGEL